MADDISKENLQAQRRRAAYIAAGHDAEEAKRQELEIAQTIDEYAKINRRRLGIIATAERNRMISETDALVARTTNPKEQ